MKSIVLLVAILTVGAACTRPENAKVASGSAAQAVGVQDDESEVRLAIYAHYMNSDSRVYLVDESEPLLRMLSARTKKSVFSLKSEALGSKLSIAGLKISGDVAQAGFAAVGGNTGAELFSVRLRKTARAWEIVEWRVSAAS